MYRIEWHAVLLLSQFLGHARHIPKAIGQSLARGRLPVRTCASIFFFVVLRQLFTNCQSFFLQIQPRPHLCIVPLPTLRSSCAAIWAPSSDLGSMVEKRPNAQKGEIMIFLGRQSFGLVVDDMARAMGMTEKGNNNVN
ncbi:hypothetical protein F4804DRAFT_182839 [Jackrogersella minutella]|nr:hypothetical protein F4804DRAFT_182839 [Jackrogersella minutella]